MGKKIMPLGDNVLIRIDAPETKTASGIYIPEPTSHERSQQGTVEAVGKSDAIEVKKGQKVIFHKYGGEEITIDNKEYVIVKSEEVIAIIE